ncbi:MAG: sensor histidine kinase [Actinomycetaceae bacterium]
MAQAKAPSGSRFDRVWLALPYVLLAASALTTWLSGDVDGPRLTLVLGVCAVVAAWHSWAVAHPEWLETRLAPMAIYHAGLVGLCAVLLNFSFHFFPLYLSCYAMAFVALPGAWAYAGVALTTVVSLLVPSLDTWSAENVAVTVVGGVLAAAAGWTIRSLDRESTRRKEALAALAAANADLERAAAENRTLQGRLLAGARSQGVASERARLAGEIHDTIAAGLSGIVAQLEALDVELGDDYALRPRVRTSVELARESLAEARRSVRALRPEPLVRHALPGALAEAVGRFGRTHGLPVRFAVTGEECSVSRAVEDVLLRGAQEAMTNVARHAGASEARVTLTFLGDTVALDVGDDGSGFDARTSGGHGLSIMRERVEEVGGRVVVDSSPGEGTVVTLTVPCGERE